MNRRLYLTVREEDGTDVASVDVLWKFVVHGDEDVVSKALRILLEKVYLTD